MQYNRVSAGRPVGMVRGIVRGSAVECYGLGA